ncbi:MAG: V-type ATP synthase subunit D [Desulfurococcales archaeon]|nr:V-type ATP synthase subunit D [Desulfurococcales archaeon]MEB3789266.1 V-type ATP synthase subunit D [Desulfurococcales archaeon]
MAVDPRKVLPTKINLIRLRREVKMLKKIRGVLEEKREVLLHYIKSSAEEYAAYQEKVLEKMNEIFKEYYKGVAEEGFTRTQSYAESAPETLKLEVGTRVLFAVKTPTFKIDPKTIPTPPYPTDASPHLTKSALLLRDLLPDLLKMAEYEEAMRRLIEELRETQRLINAMDYVILPSYQQAIKFIKTVLDERMREDFVRLKMLKKKLQSPERASSSLG